MGLIVAIQVNRSQKNDDFQTGYIVIKDVAKGKAKLNTLIIMMGGSKV